MSQRIRCDNLACSKNINEHCTGEPFMRRWGYLDIEGKVGRLVVLAHCVTDDSPRPVSRDMEFNLVLPWKERILRRLKW